jgi:uncharacterized protein (DUF1499 family)
MNRLGVFLAACLLVAGCGHNKEETLMTTFAQCPDKPNCVSSKADDEDHFIKPLVYEGEGGKALVRLKSIMSAMPRTTLVNDQGNFLQYEVKSRVMRFTDDVVFMVEEDKGHIDVRSASRVGHSDLGVNRKRVEAIRVLFSDTQ